MTDQPTTQAALDNAEPDTTPITDDLATQLRECIEGLDRLIPATIERAQAYGLEDVWSAMDNTGRPLLADLVVAKANALSALAYLEPEFGVFGDQEIADALGGIGPDDVVR